MPAPQLSPPGHLDLHVVLVALTPALLAVCAGLAAWMVEPGRGSRVLGWTAMMAALAVNAVLLVPHGVAQAYTNPLAHGLIRVGPVQVSMAVFAGGWTAWWWRPGWERGALWWGARVGIAMLLPICVIPLLLGGCEHDLRVTAAARWRCRARVWRPLVIGVATAMTWVLLHQSGTAAIWVRLPMAIAALVTAATAPPSWAVPTLAAGIAALAPLAA